MNRSEGGAFDVTRELGKLLSERRGELGWSLREVEKRTGIHNAHLSQIETGVIDRPDPNMLYDLASVYDLDFGKLMRLAGRTEQDNGRRRKSLAGTALKALDGLSPKEQEEVLKFMAKLRNRSRGPKLK